MINLPTAIELTPSGSSTVHSYIQTIHITTQMTQTIHRTAQIIIIIIRRNNNNNNNNNNKEAEKKLKYKSLCIEIK
jgi:hypothetical protein